MCFEERGSEKELDYWESYILLKRDKAPQICGAQCCYRSSFTPHWSVEKRESKLLSLSVFLLFVRLFGRRRKEWNFTLFQAKAFREFQAIPPGFHELTDIRMVGSFGIVKNSLINPPKELQGIFLAHPHLEAVSKNSSGFCIFTPLVLDFPVHERNGENIERSDNFQQAGVERFDFRARCHGIPPSGFFLADSRVIYLIYLYCKKSNN